MRAGFFANKEFCPVMYFIGLKKKRTLDAAKILKRNGGSPMRIAKSEAEAEEIWHARKVCLWSTLDYMPGHRIWTTDVCEHSSTVSLLQSPVHLDWSWIET